MKDNLLTSVRFHASLAVLIVFIVFLFVLNNGLSDTQLLTTLFLVGACGGIVATFQRLKSVPVDSHHFENSVSNHLAIIQVYASPIIAGIFSLLLMLFFVSGALEGFMTPKFNGSETAYTSVKNFLFSIKPSKNLDVALCYTWCFIAGYSEKFIPTILDKMALEPKPAG